MGGRANNQYWFGTWYCIVYANKILPLAGYMYGCKIKTITALGQQNSTVFV